jgi:hypothetical protein
VSKDEMNDMPDRKGRHTKACPAFALRIGAASILVRHMMKDGEPVSVVSPAIDALLALVADSYDEMTACGIAEMEVAEGELLMLDAQEEYILRSAKKATLIQKMGHDSWRMVLERHGFSTPTNDDILAVHKDQLEKAKAARAASADSTQLTALAALANRR